jgi:CRP-like cAMP-binding protein
MRQQQARPDSVPDGYTGGENQDTAIQALFDLVVRFAREGNLAKAKAFREKIVLLDPFAVRRIVQLEEIIDQERKRIRGPNKIDFFTQLNVDLNPEEKTALNELLRPRTYEPDAFVFKQGELNFNLYLIESGELKMTYQQDTREILLKSFSGGDIAGDDTFLKISLCTTSLVTLTHASLYALDRKDLTRLRGRLPTLESKLIRHCQGLESVYQVLAKKRLERRAHQRVAVLAEAKIQIDNSRGRLIGEPFTGELRDLSAGGLAVFCSMGTDRDPRTLLGRKLNIQFDLPVGTSLSKVGKTGTIVAVSSPSQNPCLHVKFDSLLSEKIFRSIESRFES